MSEPGQTTGQRDEALDALSKESQRLGLYEEPTMCNHEYYWNETRLRFIQFYKCCWCGARKWRIGKFPRLLP